MTAREYYTRIKEAYADENLNKISAELIGLYKMGEYSLIKRIAQVVSEYVPVEDEKISKCFSRLIMIYHPDKGHHYRKEIEALYLKGDLEHLKQYSHIFELQDLDRFISAEQIAEDIDYHPEYQWDEEDVGFNCFYDQDDEQFEHGPEPFDDREPDDTFYAAVKRKFYGTREIHLPPQYLEDLEEIEMAEYEIENLDGVELCRFVKKLDLSGNNIADIYPLKDLAHLEELDLSENQLNIIDIMVKLKRLRILDLSNNMIDDVTPLLYLNELEYVNVIGNMVPRYQVEQLQNNGVIVMH